MPGQVRHDVTSNNVATGNAKNKKAVPMHWDGFLKNHLLSYTRK